MKNYFLWLFLFAGIIFGVIPGNMHAMQHSLESSSSPSLSPNQTSIEAEEEKAMGATTRIWYHQLVDSAVDTVEQRSPIGGQWIQDMYSNYRYAYVGDYSFNAPFGYPIRFGAGADRHNFNDTDNILRVIGEIPADMVKTRPYADNFRINYYLLGAIKEEGYVYKMIPDKSDNTDRTVMEVSQFFIDDDLNAPVVFMYNAIFLKRSGEKVLRNLSGDILVTDNGKPDGRPVVYKGHYLVYKREDVDGLPMYVTKRGSDLKLTTEYVNTLPTIDRTCNPDMAVGVVLAGTAGGGLGAGLIARKILKWGYKKLFGKNQKQEKDNKKISVSSGTNIGVKEGETGKPTQQPDQSCVQPHASSNASKTAVDTKPTNVIPGRPKIGKIAIVRITPQIIAAA